MRRPAAAALLTLVALAPAAALSQEASCKGTKVWHDGACRYPDEVEALRGAAEPTAERPRQGLLTVTTVPPGATLYLSGKEVGATPFGPADVDAGIHNAILRLERYKRVVMKLTVREDRPATERLVLEPLPGLLGVVSEPPGAAVSVDGKAVGTAPLLPVPVEPGRHEVAAHLDGHEPALRTIETGADSGTLVVLELRPAPGPAPQEAEPAPGGVGPVPFLVATLAGVGAGAALAVGAAGDELSGGWLAGGGALALVSAATLTYGIVRLPGGASAAVVAGRF